MKIAVLDDYQNVALKLADWSALADWAEITVFDDPVAGPEAFIERLLLCDAGAHICVMRERTSLPPAHPFRSLDNAPDPLDAP